jgi:tetratricopeptide (TPR) repeat protein
MTEQDKEYFTLCAIYDLGVFPTSFDLAPFLLAAQGEALEKGCSRVRLLLVDGEHHGVRFEGDEYETLYPPEMRGWKVSHILQALPRLCPMVERTVSIVPREEVHLYLARYPNVMICDEAHGNYDGLYLNAWRCLDRYRQQIGFCAPTAAHHYLQNWIIRENPAADKPLVTLTLRESRWSTDRNSDLSIWAETVALLHQDGYWPVVVPDTEMAFVERGPEWHAATFCTPAAFDLELRMALYERAHLNIFTNSGPALLAIGSQNCRYLYTGITYEGTNEATLRRIRPMGMIPGLMPFRTGPYQQWIWEPVTTDLVRHSIAAMTQAMRAGKLNLDFPPFAEPFDEDHYLANFPDAAPSIEQGQFRSALDHYARVGIMEGRLPTAKIRPPSAAIAAMLDCSLQRSATPAAISEQPDDGQGGFDETYYLQLYPDVAKAVAQGQFETGRQHFLSFGRREGRFPLPLQAHGEDASSAANDRLVVYYDITIYPESFDFCFFLLAAEAYRQRIGAGSIQMMIMADAGEGWKFRSLSPEEWQKYLTTTTWWRIQHMVVALANMLPTVSDIRVMTNRAECDRIWQTARYHYPVKSVAHDVPIYQAYREALHELYRGNLLNLLEAPAAANLYVEQILNTLGLAAKRLIVITLREAIFCPERNSNIPAWISLAEELRTAGYAVIIIPDTDTVLTGTSLLDSCTLPVNVLAAFNLYIRLAFYQRAHVSLFANGGPFLLAMVGARTRYMTFIKVVKATIQTETAFLENLGFRFGQQTPYPFQRIVDQPDTLENLQREVWGLLHEMDAKVIGPHPEPDASSQSNLYDMGMQYYERGELLQAEACFQQALAVAPDVNILMSLGRVCYDLCRFPEAHEYLQEARRLSPGDMGAWNEADIMAQARLRRANSTPEVRRA